MGAEPGSPKWMLVVEDNLEDERLATRVFGRSGRKEELIIARDGEEALRVLEERGPPKAIMLDLKLPRLSGVDLLTAIRENERFRCVPIIVLTSSDHRTDIAACYDLGCNAFVRKQGDYEQYVNDLSVTLDFWLRVNVGPPIEIKQLSEQAASVA